MAKLFQGEIDNGIYNLIRLELVKRGYLSDITLYDWQTDAGLAAYRASNENRDPLIELFSTGGAMSRGSKDNASIIIDRNVPRMARSGTGSDNCYVYEASTNRYLKTKTPDIKYDIPYRITYHCNYAEDADIIEDVIRTAIKNQKFIYSLALTSSLDEFKAGFWMIRVGEFDVSGEDFLERGFLYEARNIDLDGPTDEGTVAPLEVFEVETGIIGTNCTTEVFNHETCETSNLVEYANVNEAGDLVYQSLCFELRLSLEGDLIFIRPNPTQITGQSVNERGDLIVLRN